MTLLSEDYGRLTDWMTARLTTLGSAQPVRCGIVARSAPLRPS
ncbi:MAG: hypothetical protein R2731_08150 [Nocardioides sp.]